MFILFLLCLSHVLSKHSLSMKTWATMVTQHICSLFLTMENLHCPLKSGLLGYLPGNWMDFQLAPFVWFKIWVLVFFWGTRISERPVLFQKLWRIRDLSFLSQELWKAPWEFPPLLEPRFLIFLWYLHRKQILTTGQHKSVPYGGNQLNLKNTVWV